MDEGEKKMVGWLVFLVLLVGCFPFGFVVVVVVVVVDVVGVTQENRSTGGLFLYSIFRFQMVSTSLGKWLESEEIPFHEMCQALNSHYFHIGDGHQPNSRGL